MASPTTTSEDEVKLVDMSGPGPGWGQGKAPATSINDGMASNASLARSGGENTAETTGGDGSGKTRSRSNSRSRAIEAEKPLAPWQRLLVRWRRTPPVPEQRRACPEYEAGIVSKLTFGWISSLMRLGYRRTLKLNDMYLISPARSIENHSETAEAIYKAGVASGNKNPLFWALYLTFKRDFWVAGICRLAADLFTVASPYTLRYLIQFIQDSYVSQFFPDRTAPPMEHGIGLLVGILVMQILQSFSNNHFLYRGSLVGGQMRAVLTTFIFEKSVRISGRARAGGEAEPAAGVAESDEAGGATKSKKEEGEGNKGKKEQGKKKDEVGWSTGRVINLQSMDATRIDSCVGMIHMVWTAPLVILICMALLIVNLGYSALAGFGCVVLIMAVLIKTVQALLLRRRNLNEVIDRRVGLTQEALQAIRLVKYLGWESSFLERLDKVRDEETASLQLYMTIRNVVTTLGQVLPVLAAMFAFLTWALTGHPISAAVVFSSMALFNCLRVPLNYLPVCLGLAAEGWGSLQRIQEYLTAEEVEKVEVDAQMDEAVVVRSASFTWEQSPKTGDAPALGAQAGGDQAAREPFQLRDIDVAVRRGELLAIIGSVASGKSSLLAALAGDMRRTAGAFVWGGSRALCTQTAWIQNATVRENILFGRDFDGPWYDQVIRACALDRDLEILTHGDATEIGERGINLSGGQKQRISLARAVYSRAEMLMLDDPLSAVDAYVGKHMFEHAICGLLAPCTRLLVTHHAHLWPRCDRILWLDEGRVVACDTYDNLMAHHPGFVDMVRAADANRDGDGDDPVAAAAAAAATNGKMEGVKEEEGERGGTTTTTTTTPPAERLAAKHSMPLLQKLPPKDELMQAEEQEVSSIPWAVYRSYVASAKSPLLVLATLPLLCLAQGTNILTGIWLASWSGDRYGMERDSYIAGYVAFAASQPIFLYLFGLCAAMWCTKASNTMVHRATHAVIHAPVSFFDSTPLGRIINRFSKDVDVMDFNLTEALRLFMISLAIVISIFVLIVYYFHWFAAGLGGAIIIVVLSATFYRESAREIKRHESVLRSTVFARFSEGLSGVPCIRTYGREEAFKHRMRAAVDDMDGATYLGFAAQRWLAFRLDYVGITLIMTAGVLTLVQRETQSPAISGMVLSYTLGAVQVLQFIVRQWADVENAMNGTERLHAYETRLPQETTADAVAIDSAWPPRGDVVFDNVHMRYRDGQPEVLRGFSLHVAAGEHLGIVGRTGAGKSSLIAALFRTTELSRGRIVIDGVEAGRVPLDDLRANLAIVPQETTLFRGTVRSNLDPFNTYAEWALLDALSQADLSSSLGLDHVIDEGGANLSLGQQQQLALARVLVRGNKIIVCDEATSNVDLQADDRLQATMAKAFKGRTVLTIAHRLRTILRYDRILVMDQGRIIELGTPTELFESGGVFRGMCNRSGITKKDFI